MLSAAQHLVESRLFILPQVWPRGIRGRNHGGFSGLNASANFHWSITLKPRSRWEQPPFLESSFEGLSKRNGRVRGCFLRKNQIVRQFFPTSAGKTFVVGMLYGKPIIIIIWPICFDRDHHCPGKAATTWQYNRGNSFWSTNLNRIVNI